MEEEYLYHNGTAYLSEADEKSQRKEAKRREKSGEGGFALLQAIACLILILLLLALKAIGGSTYETVREWYFTHLEDSILIEEPIDRAVAALIGEE